MKTANKCVIFPKVSWVKEVESDLEYQRYKSILDHEDALSLIMQKMPSNRVFQLIQHNKTNEEIYTRRRAYSRKAHIQNNYSNSNRNAIKGTSIIIDQTSLLPQNSFLRKYTTRQMEGFDSIALKRLEANKNKRNLSNQSKIYY